MADLPPRMLHDLQLRYDGPIPAQHCGSEQAAQRRIRGTIAVLEGQGAQCLGQAIQCDSEREDLAADLDESRLSRWQREAQKRQLAAANTRTITLIEGAARALREAAALRCTLDLPPHPLLTIAKLLGDPVRTDPR